MKYMLKELEYLFEEYRTLDLGNPREKALYNKGKGEGENELPMAISIAEPTNVGG